MKSIICEMCNSNSFIKQDGLFVCQHCGTKYTIEEARKMMVEGTVKIDNSDFVEKYLQNARRAKAKEDWEETEKYYNLVEQNAPNNIEAIFYSAYGKARAALIDSDIYKRQAAFNVLCNCISIVDDNFDMGNEEAQMKIILNISKDIFGMANSSYVYNYKKNGHGVIIESERNMTITLFNKLGNEFILTLENIAKKYSDNQNNKRVFLYNLIIQHAEYILYHGELKNTTYIKTTLIKYHQLINEIDPSHEVEMYSEKVQSQQNKNPVTLIVSIVMAVLGVFLAILSIETMAIGFILIIIGIIVAIAYMTKK